MTYGIPYTVRGWGDEIVTTVEIPPSDVPSGFSSVVRPGACPVILVPTSALTPVDTTPPEPEPGAWDLNGVLCVRWEGDDCEDADYPWCSPLHSFTTFRAIWTRYGGPGITPRRLVPAESVELPYALYDVTVEERQNGVWLAVDQEGTYCSPEAAESHGWALISAARAAREATT